MKTTLTRSIRPTLRFRSMNGFANRLQKLGKPHLFAARKTKAGFRRDPGNLRFQGWDAFNCPAFARFTLFECVVSTRMRLRGKRKNRVNRGSRRFRDSGGISPIASGLAVAPANRPVCAEIARFRFWGLVDDAFRGMTPQPDGREMRPRPRRVRRFAAPDFETCPCRRLARHVNCRRRHDCDCGNSYPDGWNSGTGRNRCSSP